METKRTLLLVVAFLAFIFVWQIGTSWVAQRMGWQLDIPRQAPPAAADADRPEELPATRPATRPAEVSAAPVTAAGLRVEEGGVARQIVLGSEEPDGPFAKRVVVNTAGAGFDEVRLNRYTAEVKQPDAYTFQVPFERDPDATRALATTELTFNGVTLDLASAFWQVDDVRTDDRRALLYVNLADGDRRVVQVRKLIELTPRLTAEGRTDVTGGYELLVRHTVENLTDAAADVRLTFNGTTAPPRELEMGYDRTVALGFLRNGRVRYEAEQVEGLRGDDNRRVFNFRDRPLAWAGTGTIYFNAIVRPEDPQQFALVTARTPNPGSGDADRFVHTTFETETLRVEAGGRVAVPTLVFLGPKTRDLLENAYFRRAGIEYDATLISPFGCTWCVFQPVVDALVFLLSAFHLVLRDWGLAIIGLVVLVRTLLHPITRRSQKNLMQMAKLAPKIQAAKEKYGDDKQKMAQAMAELAPEQTKALLFGCLPMLLQTPIWIALYSTLQATFELRHEPFLFGLTWIDDLARPDHLVEFGRTIEIIPFLGIGISGINLLPLLMGVVFYIQIKLQPQPTTALSDEQKAQQRMIQIIMVTLFPIFLYSAPSGLNIYILTSTLIGIFETKLIRRNIAREDAFEEARRLEDERLGRTPEPKPKTGLALRMEAFKEKLTTRLAEAQQAAEAQRTAPAKPKRKG